MSAAAKVASGIVGVAVLAGLIVVAVPAFAAIGVAVGGMSNTAKMLTSPDETDVTSAVTDADLIPTDYTDYATWTDADLAAARAENPFPLVVNHPSRFVGDCLQNSIVTMAGTLEGAQTLIDMGPAEHAQGAVTHSAQGSLATYTVVAGDAGLAIGERFCIDYVTLFQYNGIDQAPHPGDVMLLLPEYRL